MTSVLRLSKQMYFFPLWTILCCTIVFPWQINGLSGQSNKLPILIWWTEQSFQKAVSDTLHPLECGHPKPKCMITSNRKYLKDKNLRGVMFHGSHIKPDDLPLPRRDSHEWILYHEESPLNNYMLSHTLFISLFNYTATFRRESDFPLTLNPIPVDNYFISKKPVALSKKNKLKKTQHLAPVLYIQSHCEVPSDRDRYVQELMKHIDIDSYGSCLNNKKMASKFQDPVTNLGNEEYFDFIAQYKFHLAIENAFCEDYMTEKLMRPLHLGSIPIYKGSPSAKDWMPNERSAIFIDDFQSPKDLADFIKHLDENDAEYEKYLKFKKDGLSNENLIEALDKREWRVNDRNYPHMISSFQCFVCDKISERVDAEKRGIDVPQRFANRTHLGCGQPYTLLIDPFEVPKGDVWRRINWIELYWQAFDEALAVAEMMKNKESDPRSFHKYMRDLLKKRHHHG